MLFAPMVFQTDAFYKLHRAVSARLVTSCNLSSLFAFKPRKKQDYQVVLQLSVFEGNLVQLAHFCIASASLRVSAIIERGSSLFARLCSCQLLDLSQRSLRDHFARYGCLDDTFGRPHPCLSCLLIRVSLATSEPRFLPSSVHLC